MPGKPDPDRAAALQDWEEAFGSPPPPYLSVAFLRKALAYEDQCKRRGGIPASTRRVLRQVAEGRGVTRQHAPNRTARGSSRPGVEWPRLPGRSAADGLPNRWADLAIAVGDCEAHHWHDMVGPALLWPRRQDRGRIMKKDPLRHLHPEELRGRAGAGVQLASCQTRCLCRLHRQPEA